MNLRAALAKPALAFARWAAAAPRPRSEPLGDWWLNPAVQDRWLAPEVKHYTPQMVEYLIRDALQGDLTRQWEMFDLMERTWPRLQGNLKKLREKALAIEWFAQPFARKGAKPTAEAERRAAQLEEALWGMRPDPFGDENDFEGLLFDILDGWGKCISVQEILWETRAGETGAVVVPRAARWVNPKLYGYPDRRGQADRLMLKAEALGGRGAGSAEPGAGENWVEFLPDKFVVAVAKQKSGHPAGAALLQPLAFFWAASNFSWEWFLNFGQLFGQPIRWANYAKGADADTIGKIEAMLANMGSAAWAAFPEGTTIQLLEAVKASAEGPQERLLNAVDRICDILVLGQTLTTDVGNSGSRALGTVHAGVLSDREQAVCRFAARVLNSQLIPAWSRLNFGDDAECPYLVPDIEEEEDTKAMAEMFKTAGEAGVRVPIQFAHDKLGIPIPKDGEAVLEPRGGMPTDPMSKEPNPQEPKPGDLVAAATPATRQPSPPAAQRKLAVAVAESVTGVEAKWLGGAVPWFQALILAAESPKVTDAEFDRLLTHAQNALPEELAPLLDTTALADAMTANMGAAVLNGALGGWLARKGRTKAPGGAA
jgi:phage gp29-like protein